jgi:acetyltransferase-like isoleucine patch superfamily enzyme
MPPSRSVAAWRVAWTLVSLTTEQAIVCAVSLALPVLIAAAVLAVAQSFGISLELSIAVMVAPIYVLFALCLMVVSPVASRLLGWRTPADAEMVIAELGWPLLRWVRFGASLHVARVVAGTLFRGTPLWTFHLRLHGARLGRRVYVNTLSISDYNLIECGDDVVIGGAVHLSGHTVEAGVVKTARVRIGSHVTIGLGSVVDIGAEIGSNVQVGALSFVPKYARLEGGKTYAGAPVAPLPEH